METVTRTFEDHEAKRERVPLMVGLVGPSGSGKTFSALRVATGIQRVTGGDIFYIDTECKRALHYADMFKFRHVPFDAPFGPLHYLAAIEHCAKKGARVVVVDSMSHEHEGPGGVLEMHGAEIDRLTKGDQNKANAMSMLAWQKPKAERRRMINTILQLPISTIFCFRAKEKLKLERGKEPTPLGYKAIAGEEFTFEMTVNCLLLPRSEGVPAWESKEIGERETMKLPEQFKGIFAESAPLSEDIGEALALWAEGDDAEDRIAKEYIERMRAIGASGQRTELDAIIPDLERRWPQGSARYGQMGAAFGAASKALASRLKKPPPQSPSAPEREPGEDG